jgi:hypothetical protein
MPDEPIVHTCPACGQQTTALLPSWPTAKASLRVILTAILVVVVPAGFALATVSQRRPRVPVEIDPSPLGYTWSLLLFVVPLIALIRWHHGRHENPREKHSLWISFLLLFGLGVLLDVVFGSLFFTFPNDKATIGFQIPVVGGTVPIEEFGFYSAGFGAILMTYVWAKEYWLSAYTPNHPMVGERRKLRSLVKIDWRGIPWMLGLFAAGWLFKKYGPVAEHDGFPGYFLFLLVTGILPEMLFNKAIRHRVNWEAMHFTVVLLLPVSLLWEGSLGVPYQWWGYKPEQMLGVNIRALSGLPIEEILLWIAVGYAGITVYEFIRIWYGLGSAQRVPPTATGTVQAPTS